VADIRALLASLMNGFGSEWEKILHKQAGHDAAGRSFAFQLFLIPFASSL